MIVIKHLKGYIRPEGITDEWITHIIKYSREQKIKGRSVVIFTLPENRESELVEKIELLLQNELKLK